MPAPIALEPPNAAPIARLLGQTHPTAVAELATAVRAVLDGAFFQALTDVRFATRSVKLHASIPSFPNAIVIADGLDQAHLGEQAEALDLQTFLGAPLLLLDGREHTVAEVLAVAMAPKELARLRVAPAIDASVRAIGRVVLDAVRSIAPPVDDLRPLLAHHKVPDGGSIFVARDAALNTFGIDAPLAGGLTWAIAAKFVKPRVSRQRIAYEVGDVDPGALLFSVRTSSEGGLQVLCRIGPGSVLEVATRVDGMFDRYVKMVAVLRFAPHAHLRVWVDDVLAGGARGKACAISRLVGRQSIGAGVLGWHRSALFLRELLLVGSALGPTSRAGVSRRLDRHVRRA